MQTHKIGSSWVGRRQSVDVCWQGLAFYYGIHAIHIPWLQRGLEVFAVTAKPERLTKLSGHIHLNIHIRKNGKTVISSTNLQHVPLE